MALDPSLFMQGAQLQQQNAARRDAAINSFFDKLAATKKAEADEAKRAATDYAGAKMQYLKDKAAGVQSSPEIIAMAKAQDAADTSENAINPSTGFPYPKNRSIFDSINQGTPFVPAAQGADMSGMPADEMGVGRRQPPAMGAASPELMQGLAEADAANAPSELPNVFEKLSTALPPAANDRQALERYNAELDIAKTGDKANIEASLAGAKKASELEQENRVKTQLRNKGLGDLTTNIDKLIADAQGTPSGFMEGAAASATEFAGAPNKQSIQRAKFVSGKAISGLQSRIAFLNGQGTITDTEAAQAMAFLPGPNDPLEIKLVKLEAAKEYMSGLMGEETKVNTAKPGFKYLGTE